MKVKLEETQEPQETEIIIRCTSMDHEIKRLLDAIASCSISIKGEKDGCAYLLAIDKILYIESVDDQTFLYCDDGIYDCPQKLYELEILLKDTAFVRISKSCIVNTNCLVHVKPLFDGKLVATTTSDEALIVNRHYVKGFKEVFGL